jgi:hypothetical protein
MNFIHLKPVTQIQTSVEDDCFVSIGQLSSRIVAQLRERMEADTQEAARK